MTKYHHPTVDCNAIDASEGGQCHARCGYRKTAERFRADPRLAHRITEQALAAKPMPLPIAKCLHLGAARRDVEGRAEIVECPPCKAKGGMYKLKTFDCSVHGRCTTETPVSGVACCIGCPDQWPESLVCNMGAGGLGDALLGSCAVNGLRKLHPNRPIVYKAREQTLPFLRLFDLGVTLANHDWDNQQDRPPGDPNVRDMQMNAGNGAENQFRGKFYRLERFCRNLGGVTPERPVLRDRDSLTAAGADFTGAVILSPFSLWAGREWPVENWLGVERLLMTAGKRVVVMDDRSDRPARFKSEKIIGASAERVAGIMLNAACVVSNDSGLAHLSALLGVRTIVLCGQVTGPSIYGFYGRNVSYLDGHLACRGCWWQPPYNGSCEPKCPNLLTIMPAEVLRAVAKTF